MILRLILVFIFFLTGLSAVSITLDGTQTRISGSECATATYRFGTDSSYQGEDLDLLLEVTAEDNDYAGGACVNTQDDVVSFHIRDNDRFNNYAYMDLKFTVVKKGTLIPVAVDLLTATNFDLDSNPPKTLTDDVYYKNPLQTLISGDSEVELQTGDFYGYSTKLRGKTNGNCNDSATLTELSCRAGAIWKNTSSIFARVQNDNAYGTSTYTYDHRLIQFSFEYDDIEPLIEESSSEGSCGIQNYSTISNTWVEGDTHSPYNSYLNIQKSITIPGATELEITINGETEDLYDFLYITDEQGNEHVYSGEFDNERLTLTGSSLNLRFTSDYSVEKEGVTVTIKGLGCSEAEESAICYALPDDSSTLYKVVMDPTAILLPQPSTISLSETFNGEGTAYRASNNSLYTFKEIGGSVKMYGINLSTYNQETIKDNLFSGTVEGAEFYYDINLEREILYIISQENDSKLYAFDSKDWSILEGYPKNTNSDLSSLAIDPISGKGYAIDDYNYDNKAPKLYTIDLKTAQTALLSTLSNLADAESLAFASDGKLYLEDEGRNDLDDRKIYQVDPNTGTLISSAILGGDDDVEGLSCNGTQIAISKPSISIVSNPSITEGDSGTKEMIFDIILSKPALEDITFEYQLTDITAIKGIDYTEGSIPSTQTITIPKDANSTAISVLIMGDHIQEDNETFSLQLINIENAIFNEESLSAIGTIINDDTNPIVSIYDANITEGHSGTKQLSFNLFLDIPAPSGGLTVELSPSNITAIEGEDYTRYTSSIYFSEGESNQTIDYLINGDVDIEEDEKFEVHILSSNNFDIDPEHAVAIGTIINDDYPTEKFECTSESYLSSNSDIFSLNFMDKSATLLKANYTDENINAIGYNMNDDLIWGWSRSSKQIVQIDANYTVKAFKTEIPALDFVAGDISKDGVLYLSGYDDSNELEDKFDNHTIYKVKIENGIPSYIGSVAYSNQNIHFGDYAINPKDDHLYAIDANTAHLFRVNPETGFADDLGNVAGLIDNQTYFYSYVFDSDGYLYFYSNLNNATVYQIDLSNVTTEDISNPSFIATPFSNIEGLTATGGDGARCANAKMPNPITPTGCIASAFMFQGTTDVYALNLANGEMPAVQDIGIHTQNINSEGYNIKDGFFWGYNHTKRDGTIAKIGLNPNGVWATQEFKIEGLEGFDSYVGDIDSHGHLYLKEGGSSSNVMVIDLDPASDNYLKKIQNFKLSEPLDTADWAFNPKDNMLYAVNNGSTNKYLYQINPSTGEVIYKKNTLLINTRGFGASFFDANGFYYVYDNYSGEIFRIDVANSATAVLFSTSRKVSLNDGAMCTSVEFKFDFGDLPENYPTKLENNGARHSFPAYGETTVYLGEGIESENDGDPSIQANLDQFDDGVMVNNTTLQGATLEAGSSQTFEITTHGIGYLNAWIDWNADGDFDDSQEKIAHNILGSDSRTITLTIEVPAGGEDIITYARFRYSSQEDLLPTGSAIDGEVEDYKITIQGNQTPFICNETLYLSNRSEIGTSSEDSGASWLHQIIRPEFAYAPIGNGYISSNGGYNALGYNIQDNYMYALYGNHLLKIGSHANVKDLGAVEGLSVGQRYAGEFDRNGYYYVSGTGSDDNSMYKIDVTQQKVVQTITLSDSVRFWDMAIDPSGEYFYVMLIEDGDADSDYNNGKFAKINIATGEITTIGEAHDDLSSYISLIFSDADGKVVALANDGGFYEIIPESGNTYIISPSQPLTFYNDGTSCPDANISLPPHPPRLSISDVSQPEGDSGETTFNFTVTADKPFDLMPGTAAIFYYEVIDGDGERIVPPHGIALSDDHDFNPLSGIGMGINMFGDDLKINIPVTVYGDTKIEKDEEFYVVIYSPQIPTNLSPSYMIDKNIGVGLIINDDMELKIERPSNATGDLSSLYTQISGRDFDYALASYSGEEPYPLEDMTFKVELIDTNSSNSDVLYTGYLYFENNSRVEMINPDDLKIARATRDAHFRVSYLKDENGSNLKGLYNNETDYNAYKENPQNSEMTLYDSSDHFAIRPALYQVSIGDKDEENNSIEYQSNSINETVLKLASEYDYLLKVKALMENNQSSTPRYNTKIKELNSTLIFDDTNMVHCFDTNDSNIENYYFNEGQMEDKLSHNNVGNYTLHIEDSNWSSIDQTSDKLGCVLESHSNIPDESGKIGCNIASNEGSDHQDIKIMFQPYRFEFTNTDLSNINGNNKDYLYMSDLKHSQRMGVKLQTTLVAQGEKGTTLTNFTQGCMAESLQLDLNLSFKGESDLGEFNSEEPFTLYSIGGQELNPQNIIELNDQNSSEVTTFNQISLSDQEFLDKNQGEVAINILYNMEKPLDDPSNPIKVEFLKLDVNTTDISNPIAGKELFPHGEVDINQTRIYYFARVASSSEVYPETDKIVQETPLFIEIFCKENNQTWCEENMDLNHTGQVIQGETILGWYQAIGHNGSTDGNVSQLISSNPKIGTRGLAPFVNGFMSSLETIYISDEALNGENQAEIAIESDVWLRFNRRAILGVPLGTSSYIVKIKGASSKTGIGEAGLEYKNPKRVEFNGKMSW